MTEPKPREVITIYEIDASGRTELGQGRLQFPMDAADRPVRRGAQDHRLPRRAGRSLHRQGKPRHPEERAHSDPAALRRPGLAPKEADIVDSIPPSYFGGNIDNWRIGKGATMYYPVAVPARCYRLAIRMPRRGIPSSVAPQSNARSPAPSSSSCTRRRRCGHARSTLDYPLLETQDEWVLHGFSYANYLAELGDKAQSQIY